MAVYETNENDLINNIPTAQIVTFDRRTLSLAIVQILSKSKVTPETEQNT